jgi:hypothetical protein
MKISQNIIFLDMEEFEYRSLLEQLNEEQRLIFDDVMHRK